MRVKVIRDFKDKGTGILHKKEAEIEITSKRLGEINSTSYGVFAEEIKIKKDKK